MLPLVHDAVRLATALQSPAGYGDLVNDLGSERYVSITSFRWDGTAVATPVWVVPHDGRLYVPARPGAGRATGCTWS